MHADGYGSTRGLKAFLLAAGLGTRLRPFTDSRPKCLVEVGGQTMLDRWLDSLRAAGVDEVLVNTHHFADVVAAHLAGRTGAPLVHVVHEEELLGSAGTLRANREFVTDEEMFLVVNADNLTDFDLARLVAAHRAGGSVATLSVFRAPRPSECGVVEVDDLDRVVGFREKPAVPRSELANAGMYAFAPSVIDEVPEPLPRDIGFDLLGRLVGRARALDIGGSYLTDIGTVSALEQARKVWESRTTA
jgi:mannose-1-phosphate guanylyltransferase